jgi:hypothetical protein
LCDEFADCGLVFDYCYAFHDRMYGYYSK